MDDSPASPGPWLSIPRVEKVDVKHTQTEDARGATEHSAQVLALCNKQPMRHTQVSSTAAAGKVLLRMLDRVGDTNLAGGVVNGIKDAQSADAAGVVFELPANCMSWEFAAAEVLGRYRKIPSIDECINGLSAAQQSPTKIPPNWPFSGLEIATHYQAFKYIHTMAMTRPDFMVLLYTNEAPVNNSFIEIQSVATEDYEYSFESWSPTEVSLVGQDIATGKTIANPVPAYSVSAWYQTAETLPFESVLVLDVNGNYTPTTGCYSLDTNLFADRQVQSYAYERRIDAAQYFSASSTHSEHSALRMHMSHVVESVMMCKYMHTHFRGTNDRELHPDVKLCVWLAGDTHNVTGYKSLPRDSSTDNVADAALRARCQTLSLFASKHLVSDRLWNDIPVVIATPEDFAPLAGVIEQKTAKAARTKPVPSNVNDQYDLKLLNVAESDARGRAKQRTSEQAMEALFRESVLENIPALAVYRNDLSSKTLLALYLAMLLKGRDIPNYVAERLERDGSSTNQSTLRKFIKRRTAEQLDKWNMSWQNRAWIAERFAGKDAMSLISLTAKPVSNATHDQPTSAPCHPYNMDVDTFPATALFATGPGSYVSKPATQMRAICKDDEPKLTTTTPELLDDLVGGVGVDAKATPGLLHYVLLEKYHLASRFSELHFRLSSTYPHSPSELIVLHADALLKAVAPAAETPVADMSGNGAAVGYITYSTQSTLRGPGDIKLDASTAKRDVLDLWLDALLQDLNTMYKLLRDMHGSTQRNYTAVGADAPASSFEEKEAGDRACLLDAMWLQLHPRASDRPLLLQYANAPSYPFATHNIPQDVAEPKPWHTFATELAYQMHKDTGAVGQLDARRADDEGGPTGLPSILEDASRIRSFLAVGLDAATLFDSMWTWTAAPLGESVRLMVQVFGQTNDNGDSALTVIQERVLKDAVLNDRDDRSVIKSAVERQYYPDYGLPELDDPENEPVQWFIQRLHLAAVERQTLLRENTGLTPEMMLAYFEGPDCSHQHRRKKEKWASANTRAVAADLFQVPAMKKLYLHHLRDELRRGVETTMRLKIEAELRSDTATELKGGAPKLMKEWQHNYQPVVSSAASLATVTEAFGDLGA